MVKLDLHLNIPHQAFFNDFLDFHAL